MAVATVVKAEIDKLINLGQHNFYSLPRMDETIILKVGNETVYLEVAHVFHTAEGETRILASPYEPSALVDIIHLATV